MFINNTFQYTVGDFPLSKKDFDAAFRCVHPGLRAGMLHASRRGSRLSLLQTDILRYT